MSAANSIRNFCRKHPVACIHLSALLLWLLLAGNVSVGNTLIITSPLRSLEESTVDMIIIAYMVLTYLCLIIAASNLHRRNKRQKKKVKSALWLIYMIVLICLSAFLAIGLFARLLSN